MKHSLIVAVILCGGCFGGASEAHRQQQDMIGQIGEEIYTQGASPQAQIARDLLVANASIQNLLGMPEEKLVYTSENVEATAGVLAEEAESKGFWDNVLKGISGLATTAASAIPGLGWIVPLLGMVATTVEVIRRNKKKVQAITNTAHSLVASIKAIKDKSKEGKLTIDIINDTAKKVQEDVFKTREEVRALLKEVKV